MAKSEWYMNGAQRSSSSVSASLDLQKQLRPDNAGATTEHLRELSFAPDPADRATLEEEHALELRTRDRERKLLKKIDSALARIDDGTYGYCEETGDRSASSARAADGDAHDPRPWERASSSRDVRGVTA